jgi:hypothetical protein
MTELNSPIVRIVYFVKYLPYHPYLGVTFHHHFENMEKCVIVINLTKMTSLNSA